MHTTNEAPDQPLQQSTSGPTHGSEISTAPAARRAPIDETAHPETVLLRPEEAGDRLRLSRARIYELMATGELESIKIDRSRRVPLLSLIEFIKSRQA